MRKKHLNIIKWFGLILILLGLGYGGFWTMNVSELTSFPEALMKWSIVFATCCFGLIFFTYGVHGK